MPVSSVAVEQPLLALPANVRVLISQSMSTERHKAQLGNVWAHRLIHCAQSGLYFAISCNDIWEQLSGMKQCEIHPQGSSGVTTQNKMYRSGITAVASPETYVVVSCVELLSCEVQGERSRV
jgi:hypothetical protein